MDRFRRGIAVAGAGLALVPVFVILSVNGGEPGSVLGVISGVLAAAGIFGGLAMAGFAAAADKPALVPAEGTVVRIIRVGSSEPGMLARLAIDVASRGKVWYPPDSGYQITVEFRAEDGRVITGIDYQKLDPFEDAGVRVGSPVSLLYDPAQPEIISGVKIRLVPALTAGDEPLVTTGDEPFVTFKTAEHADTRSGTRGRF